MWGDDNDGSSRGGEGMMVRAEYNEDDDKTAHTCPHTFPPPPYPSPSLSTIIFPSPTLLCQFLFSYLVIYIIIYSVNLIFNIIIIKQTCR